MGRSWDEFANDTSLHHRLHDAVRHMMRSGESWKNRARYAFDRMTPITPACFPDECKTAFELFRALDYSTLREGGYQPYRAIDQMTAKQRDAVVDALMDLYLASERARATYSR